MQILDDRDVIKASQKFVRVIVRRPHAYEFKMKQKDAPIPGVVFLDADGKLVGADHPETTKQLLEKMNGLTQ